MAKNNKPVIERIRDLDRKIRWHVARADSIGRHQEAARYQDEIWKLMPEAAKTLYDLFNVVNRDSAKEEGGVVVPLTPTGFDKEFYAEQIQNIYDPMTDELADTLAGELEKLVVQRSMSRVYVASGCTAGDMEAVVDDPRSLVEGGMSDFGAPQFMGVYTSLALALGKATAEMVAQVREFMDDGETEYLPGQHPLDKAHWVDIKGMRADFNAMACEAKTFATTLDMKEGDEVWQAYVEAGRDPNAVCGRPTTQVFLDDPEDEDNPWACVVVQEAEVDE